MLAGGGAMSKAGCRLRRESYVPAMILASLVVNLAVLVPLLGMVLRGSEDMARVYGPDAPSRRILISVYGAIAMLSAVGLAGYAVGAAKIVALLPGLLAVQVVYKLLTWPMVGLGNPVVVANLFIAAFHGVALALWWVAA